VSNTHADIVAVLCVIVLLGLAPAEVSVTVARSLGATQPTPSGELLAMGDSYMSGEGARTFISDTDEAGNDTCRRAPTAYAVLAIGLEDQFNHLTFLACSGARTNNVLPQPGQKSACTPVQITPCAQNGELMTQVDQIKALVARPQGYKPSLVILTIGGNDAGFAERAGSPGHAGRFQHLARPDPAFRPGRARHCRSGRGRRRAESAARARVLLRRRRHRP
jgi:GDSL-like Lipase/Acylhydrolase family